MKSKLLLIGSSILLFAAVIVCIVISSRQVSANEKDYYILDSYAFEQGDPYDEASVDRLAAKINTLQATLFPDNEVYVSIIPEKEHYADDRAPAGTDYDTLVRRLDDRLAEAELIRIDDMLALESYYHTDPHWRQEALFPVAERLGKHMGFVALASEFTTESWDGFQGTCASYIDLGNQTETITWLTDAAVQAAQVTYYGHEASRSVYNTLHLEENGYDMFLEGAVPLLTIDNPLCTTGETLVMFRDSFGSSLAPLLVHQYSRIVMIDLRYMHSNLLKELVEFGDAQVLFLLSTSIANQSLVLR